MRLVPTYRQRSSPLHVARAGAAAALPCALALPAALYAHPLVLGATLLAVIVCAVAARVGRELLRSLWFALPFALLVTLINPLVYPEGDTLLVRGGELFGRRFDVTLEATFAGALAGLRVVVLIAAFGLLSVCVDPDELTRLFWRVSYRSALTATLATRLVPVLARDAARMSDAARCRPTPPPRLAVLRAALSGALERALEVAAALEVRGFSRGRLAPGARRPWSRHDLRVACAAALIAALAIAAKLAGTGAVETYPRIELAAGAGELALAASVLLAVTLPFAGRGARLGVARA